jgi:hypothetical protein
MAGGPSWQQRYDQAAAGERQAGMAAARAWASQPFPTFLLKQLLIGLALGLFGWLVFHWIWGLISLIGSVAPPLIARMYLLRRYGESELTHAKGSPEVPGDS